MCIRDSSCCCSSRALVVIEVVRREVSSSGKVKVFNIERYFNIEVLVINFLKSCSSSDGVKGRAELRGVNRVCAGAGFRPATLGFRADQRCRWTKGSKLERGAACVHCWHLRWTDSRAHRPAALAPPAAGHANLMAPPWESLRALHPTPRSRCWGH